MNEFKEQLLAKWKTMGSEDKVQTFIDSMDRFLSSGERSAIYLHLAHDTRDKTPRMIALEPPLDVLNKDNIFKEFGFEVTVSSLCMLTVVVTYKEVEYCHQFSLMANTVSQALFISANRVAALTNPNPSA